MVISEWLNRQIRVKYNIEAEFLDDGVGFELSEVVSHSGFGIFSIWERLEQLDGHLEIESEPGLGSKFYDEGAVEI